LRSDNMIRLLPSVLLFGAVLLLAITRPKVSTSYWFIVFFGGLVFLILSIKSYANTRSNVTLCDALFELSFLLIGLSNFIHKSIQIILSHASLIVAGIAMIWTAYSLSVSEKDSDTIKQNLLRTIVLTLGILIASFVIAVLLYLLTSLLVH
jgi:hypothetical protein